MGVAAAFRNNLLMKSAARVRLDKRGTVTVETDMTDIGTGSYTIIAQTAAEMMGVAARQGRREARRFALSRFRAGSGGQWGGNNSTAGVYAACMKLREAVAQKLGFDAADADFADGQSRQAAAARRWPKPRATRARRRRRDRIRRPRQEIPAINVRRAFRGSRRGFLTGETRVRRMLAVCAAGRILNPKSARSQVIGAMTMGVGAALMEDLVVDKRVRLLREPRPGGL